MGVEKRKDISIMFSFGAKRHQVRNVFISQGLIIGLISVILGSLIGVSLTWVQETYGLVQIQMTSSILTAYPVDFLFKDLILVAAMVIFVAFVDSLFPGIISTSKNNFNNIKKTFV